MHPAKQTLALLRRRPSLWAPQAVAAVLNLLLSTASTAFAHRLSHHFNYNHGALFTSGLTLHTPDLLVASEAVQVPPVLLSQFIQYVLVLAAFPITAALVRWPQATLTQASTWTARHRAMAVLTAGLLIIGLVLADYMFYAGIETAFSYVPAFQPAPAWLLIVLLWITDITATSLLFIVAVPWTLALTLPLGHHTLSRPQKNSARLALFLGWGIVNVLQYAWGRLEGHWLPPRVDPGPFWHAPITLGHPVIDFLLFTFLAVFASILTGNLHDRS